MFKKISALLLAFAILVTLCGCAKKFNSYEFSIKLPDNFSETQVSGYNSVYASENLAIFTLRTTFDMKDGLSDMSAKDYAELVLSENKREAEITDDGMFSKFQYTSDSITYINYVAKSSNAFWVITFTAENDDIESEEKNIENYVKSIRFS